MIMSDSFKGMGKPFQIYHRLTSPKSNDDFWMFYNCLILLIISITFLTLFFLFKGKPWFLKGSCKGACGGLG